MSPESPQFNIATCTNAVQNVFSFLYIDFSIAPSPISMSVIVKCVVYVINGILGKQEKGLHGVAVNRITPAAVQIG